MKKNLIISFLTIIFQILLIGKVNAGGGSLTPAPPNPFGIRALLNFTVNFRYPPIQPDLDRLEAELRVANCIICDATDGQIVFGNIRVTAGSVNESEADIWIFPEPGRAGVSVYFDGSSLIRDGIHITMFSNSIDGVVIAHELAHLAFGILDEYSEQCRWGGPCGIGPCLEASILDSRNSSLMQQTPDATEFCVAANHDLLRGDGSGCPTSTSCPSGGICTDANVCTGYNGTTGRYELSQQTLSQGVSGWETLVRNLGNTYGIEIGLPVGLPEPDQPANCANFMNVSFQVEATDVVVLAMDNSGSMNTKDVGERTRMEFTKAAARAFIDLQNNKGISVGLVTFNSTANVLQNIQPLNNTSINGFRDDIISIAAGGNTAIGEGLFTSAIEIEIERRINPIRNPTIFLLSDGQNNRGADPKEIAELVVDRNITINTIAVGNGADTDLLSDIATSSGGIMLSAQTDDIIPPNYAELAARHQGMSMANVINVERTTTGIPGVEFGPIIAVDKITFLVEKGAEEINIFRSLKGEFTRTIGSGSQTEQAPFQPEKGVFNFLGYLESPEGFTFIPNTSRIIDSLNYYEIVKISKPTPGVWSYYLERDISNNNEKFHFRAFIKNENPDFYIDALPRIIRPGDADVKISASATYGGQLYDPAISFEGYVLRPDSSIVDLSFITNPFTGIVTADFDSFNGRGIYKVFSEVNVPTGANLLPGEVIFDGPDSGVNSVLNFARIATTSFFVDSPGCTPCQNEDCDNDKIPNSEEDKYGDIDNDGLPNRCDEDSDGDDIPDEIELLEDKDQDDIPDSYDPDLVDNGCGRLNGLVLKVISVKNPSCGQNDGSIEVIAEGAEGKVKYTWLHDLTLDSNSATNLGRTEYLVRAEDESGCSVTLKVPLTINCNPEVLLVVNCPKFIPQHCIAPVKVLVDMTQATAPDNLLGSFSGTLSWDPTVLQPVGLAKLLSDFQGFVKLDTVNHSLFFNGVNSAGVQGLVEILEIKFKAIGNVGDADVLNVNFSAMAAANTFTNLLPILNPGINCSIVVGEPNLLGDVNGDNLVNSTDALIIQSFDVGLPIPANIQARIDLGLGDVNRDDVTNTTDALIILAFEAGIPVPYPVGETVCPGDAHKSGKDNLIASNTKNMVKTVRVIYDVNEDPDNSEIVEIPVFVDMTGSQETLGSFSGKLSWDSNTYTLIGYEGGKDIVNPIVNDREVAQLSFAHANPEGDKGIIHVLSVKLRRVRQTTDKDIQLTVKNMAAAGTYDDLLVKAEVKTFSDENTEQGVKVYPNPFHNLLKIDYELVEVAQVKISLFNGIGEEVAILFEGNQPKGEHSLHWQADQGVAIPEGFYIIQIQMNDLIVKRKMILSK